MSTILNLDDPNDFTGAKSVAGDRDIGPIALGVYSYARALGKGEKATVRDIYENRFKGHTGGGYESIAKAVDELIVAGVWHRLNVRTGEPVGPRGTRNLVTGYTVVTKEPTPFEVIAARARAELAVIIGCAPDQISITQAPAGSRKLTESLTAAAVLTVDNRAGGYPQKDETAGRTGVRGSADPGSGPKDETAGRTGVRASGYPGGRVSRDRGTPAARSEDLDLDQKKDLIDQIDSSSSADRTPATAPGFAGQLGYPAEDVQAAVANVAARLVTGEGDAAAIVARIAVKITPRPRSLSRYVAAVTTQDLASWRPASPAELRSGAPKASALAEPAGDCRHRFPGGLALIPATGLPRCPECRTAQAAPSAAAQ